MKNRSSLALIVLLATTLAFANLVSASVNSNRFSESFPASACPSSSSGMTSTVSTGNKSTPFRRVAGKLSSFKPVQSSRYAIGADPILLDSADLTAVVWQSFSGVWGGSTICVSPEGEQWFIGGTGDVTSKGRLQLVNSGLSDATVDISVWSEGGEQSGKSLTIKANSAVFVRLDSLAPGQKSLALKVSPRSGRVSAFMLDERGKGLHSLGGDVINPVNSAERELVIPAVPQQVGKEKTPLHLLRVLVPGDIDANIQVDLVSNDGTFTPLGLDNRLLKHGTVNDIALNPTVNAQVFALHIHSDQPIVAGVMSSLTFAGHREFLWSSSAPQLTDMSLAINGLDPMLIFTGDLIKLKIETRLSDGKTKNSTVSGADVALWNAPKDAVKIRISAVSPGIFAAGIISSASGIGYFPLMTGSSLTRAAIPISNIRVINR